MVHNEVEHDADAVVVACLDEGQGVGEGAVAWVDGFVVADVVAHVDLRAGVEGGDPDGVDAQVFEVGELRGDAAEVADAVAVRVFEAGRPDLVDDAVFPPGPLGDGGGKFAHCEGLLADSVADIVLSMLMLDD